MKRTWVGVTDLGVVWRFLATWVVALCTTAPFAFADDEAAKPARDSATNAANVNIVCLHTEYLPYEKKGKSLPFRLDRELGRQAVLIAARDELGLATRDETLGEPFPKAINDAGADVDVRVRSYSDESVQIALAKKSGDGNDSALTITPPKDLPDDFDTYTLLVHLTQRLEAMSRGELAERLRKLGFAGNVPAANAENVPPETVKDLLLDMNFVSQFAAVRAAHAAIREEGQSPEWLGVLARGYANLALMTQHHWKSDNEVFAARALLYAERLLRLEPTNPSAVMQRAYVRAIVGLHGAALEDVALVRDLREKSANSVGVPGWFDLIEPFCNFEREPVLAIGTRRESLAPLATRLSLEQTRAYGNDRWLFTSGQRAIEACPEEYGVYAILADPDAPLGVGRMGMSYGPYTLNLALPQRVLQLADLPKGVKDVVNDTKKETEGADNDKNKEKKEEKSASDNPLEDVLLEAEAPRDVPAEVAQALVAISTDPTDRGEPSWSVLGNLIAEEQFVQAAKYFQIGTNATEWSMDEAVDALALSIKGHRYERHILAYRVNSRLDAKTFYEVLGDMQFVDPRGNMTPMLRRAWYAPDAKGEFRRGRDAAWAAFVGRDLTLPGLLEAYDELGDYWWEGLDPKIKKIWAHDFATISPHVPQALRLEMITTDEQPDLDKTAEWESRAGEDPTAYRWLGGIYASHEQFADAFRCYETSIGLSPERETFVDLANAYRVSGQEEMWEPTLERFFEVESMGLEHAQVHQMIARDWIRKGDWEMAEPHALEAAETWSAWGLELAAHVTEALGKWEDSEKWIREMSTSYPSGSGSHWYFWCRRNGRGDAAEARKIAATYFSAGRMKTTEAGRLELLTFNLLEGNSAAALDDAKFLNERLKNSKLPFESRAFYEMMLALVARDSNEKETETVALEELRATAKKVAETDADLAHVDEFVCRLFDGETPGDEEWTAMKEHLRGETIGESRRASRHYILGRLCELNNDMQNAKANFELSKAASYYDDTMPTLAGMRLKTLAKADAK